MRGGNADLTATGFVPLKAIDVANGATLTDVEVCSDHVYVSSVGPSGKKGRGEVAVFKINADRTLTKKSTTTVGASTWRPHAPSSLAGRPTMMDEIGGGAYL